MAKRVSFDLLIAERDEDRSHGLDATDDEELAQPLSKKSKHTLDSDEEDDEEEDEKYNIMELNDCEGEEEGVVRREQDVTITPFNMNEELEEGHIDQDGMYIFNKKGEEITDHWLDNIDAVELKEPTVNNVINSDNEVQDNKIISTNECYRKMISLLDTGETVQKAIQRLGKIGKRSIGSKLQPEGEVARSKMLELIAAADQVLDAGDMDIYERSLEQLKYRLNEAQKVSQGALDMFADPNDGHEEEAQVSTDSSVSWYLKWDDSDDAEVYGPLTNEQMLHWSGEGYFDKGAWVRQAGKRDVKFYSTRRIDFELYC